MDFNFTELEAGEKIVFGPITTAKTTSVSGGSGPGQTSLSHSSGRTVGITTQRVVVEDLKTPEKTQIMPNSAIQQVFIKRQQRKGQPSITLVKAKAMNGQIIELDMKGLPAQSEAMLQETFPGAEIVQSKGGVGSKVLLIVAILVGAVVFLTCILPLILSVFVRLFGG